MPLLSTCLLVLSCSAGEPATTDDTLFDDAFRSHWQDGKAEVALYALDRTRYGQPRTGQVEMITVTEDFSTFEQVKADRPGEHVVPIIKLNLLQEFRTGVYDYRTMLSVFSATERWDPETASASGGAAGEPLKVAFSSQEWCGSLFHQVNFRGDQVHSNAFSYFSGESERDRTLRRPDGAITEDGLLLWARGLAGPRLDPGTSRDVDMLRSLEMARLDHRPLTFETVTLARSGETMETSTPAGSFTVREAVATVNGPDARTWTFLVEDAPPHRIIAWRDSRGFAATLTGVERMPYWNLSKNGDEARREALEEDGR